MKKDPTLDALPTDMYRPVTDAATAWRSLEQQGTESRLKRMDIAYEEYVRELQHGKQGWVERVALNLGLNGEKKQSKATVSTAVAMFKTFRLTGEHGLGMTLEELAQYSYTKLRPIAQNRAWALENRDTVRELLNDPTLYEDDIRARIHEAQGKVKKDSSKDAKGFEKVELVLTTQDAEMFREILEAVRKRAEDDGEPVTGDNPGVVNGKLVMKALADWLNEEFEVETENGQVVTAANLEWLPGMKRNPGAANVAQEHARA